MYSIKLNSNHEIFRAHFPGNPIVPGVCIIQIVKELAEDVCGRKLAIRTVKNLKFLQILSPIEHPEVSFEVNVTVQDISLFEVKAVVSLSDLIFTKMSLICAID